MKISQKVTLVVASLAMVVATGLAAMPVSAEGFKYNESTKACEKDSSATPAYSSAAACQAANCPPGDTTCYAGIGASSDDRKDGLFGILQVVLNSVFGVIGFIAVVMLVYGGIQYTISSGDAGKVKKAKDTILYGIVGLVIALLAAAIVNFVLVNMLG